MDIRLMTYDEPGNRDRVMGFLVGETLLNKPSDTNRRVEDGYWSEDTDKLVSICLI